MTEFQRCHINNIFVLFVIFVNKTLWKTLNKNLYQETNSLYFDYYISIAVHATILECYHDPESVYLNKKISILRIFKFIQKSQVNTDYKSV